MVALYPLVQQAVNLQNSHRFRINEKGQVFDQMGASLIRGEIDHHYLFLMILLQEGGRILNNLDHSSLFLPVLFQPLLDKGNVRYLLNWAIPELLNQISHIGKVIFIRLKMGNLVQQLRDRPIEEVSN